MKTNKYQIIHVVSYFPPHLGGMENAVLEIVKKQADKNSVTVFTSNIGIKEKLVKIHNLNIQYLKSLEFAHTPIMFSLLFKLLKISKKSIIHLHISQALSPEIVFLVSKLKNIPYVAHVHLDVDPSGTFGFLLKPYKKYFLKRVLKSASKIICLSENQKKNISKKYSIDPNMISVIPNGVGNKFFVNKSKKNIIPHLLYVGRLAPQKNLPILIGAVKNMKTNVYLDIVGAGEEELSIKKILKLKKINNVRLHGRKTPEELINFYRNSDVFVISSEKEGISLSMLEAMAAGLPIVGSDKEGIRDLIKTSGILVKNPNAENFAKTLDKVLSNTETLKKLSKLSVRQAEKYSWNKISKNIEEVYKEVYL